MWLVRYPNWQGSVEEKFVHFHNQTVMQDSGDCCESRFIRRFYFCGFIWKPQSHQTRKANQNSYLSKRTLSARMSNNRSIWILGWVVLCEICVKCKLHICYWLYSPNAEQINTCFDVVTFKSSGVYWQRPATTATRLAWNRSLRDFLLTGAGFKS